MSVPQLFPPGHFYSPIVDPASIRPYLSGLSSPSPEIAGIDLAVEDQLALLETLRPKVDLWRVWAAGRSSKPRYDSGNDQFGPGDAACYAGMLGNFAPNRVVEIGSGWSSALALDAIEAFQLTTRFTFIEPYPERLFSAIRRKDRGHVEIREEGIQQVGEHIVDELRENDVLFIDSTHVMKAGSDVQFIVDRLLPRLAPGVLVHIHDMFYPFEYPQAWIEEGRNWNELYAMRAFLQFNARFRVRFWNHFLMSTHAAVIGEQIPETRINPGGGLWLQVAT